MICANCNRDVQSGFKFCGYCGQRLPLEPSAASCATTTQVEPERSLQDERRDVVVLFADVCEFTPLCSRLDPEEVHSVMNDCFTGLTQVIQEYDGYIDRYLGDALLVLFGAPVAHEDDPVLACRAALGMQAFMNDFAEESTRKTGKAMQLRIGISSGRVVAGGVGHKVRLMYGARGDPMNIAARLQSLAAPGGVLISDAVARRVRERFALGPAQRLVVKGKNEPITAFQLFHEHPDRGRCELPSSSFVGRKAELGLLIKTLRRARANNVCIEVCGEMGIGKSRLVEEAARRVNRRLIKATATTESSRRPFGLARTFVLEAVHAMADEPSSPWSRETFAATLSRLGPNLTTYADALWYLAAPTRYAVPAPDADPLILRRTLERGLTCLLRQLAEMNPDLVLVLDSYELADEASATLFESMAHDPAGYPMPVMLVSRDDGRPPLDLEHVIRVSRLGTEESAALLAQLLNGAKLPTDVQIDLLTRAAGVPLHLQELVRALIDEGFLQPAEQGLRWSQGPGPVSVKVPDSIRAGMVSRLDRLERPLSELLRQCSIQGVEFDLDVAEKVRTQPRWEGPALPALLPKLEQAGFVKDQKIPNRRLWAFYHPLMREACYDTLLMKDRRLLHADTAAALCTVAGGAEAVSAEALAYHYEQAEQWREAAEAHLRAGDRAASLFLNPEATGRYRQALDAFRRQDLASAEDQWKCIEALALEGMATVQLRIGAYATAERHAIEMRACSVRARDGAEADRLLAGAYFHLGRTQEAERLLMAVVKNAANDVASVNVAIEALLDLAELSYRAGRHADALAHLAQCRNLTRLAGSPATVRIDMQEGKISHATGRLTHAQALYERAYEAAERLGSLSERARARNNLGNLSRDLGNYDDAQRHFARALEIWEQTGDAECVAGAHNNLGNLAMSRGDFVVAERHHAQSLAACERIGNIHGVALAQANLAILANETDDNAMAVSHARRALETLGSSGNALLRGLVLVVLGEGLLACQNLSGAQSAFETVLRDYNETDHPLAIAGAYRGLGRAALLRGNPRAAISQLDRAAAMFDRLKRAQEAMRTAVYRSRAMWDLGSREQARAELKLAHRQFIALHAEADARRTEQLLQELL